MIESSDAPSRPALSPSALSPSGGTLGGPARRSGLAPVAAVTLLALAAVAAAPFVLDTYTVNILIRSLLYATVALTVDLLWGYAGILTFGQSAFFGIGAYALGLASTHLGFDGGTMLAALAGGVAVAAAVAALTGWLAFGYGVSPLYISVVTLVLPIVVTQLVFSGGTFTGSSSGLSGFETFDLSLEGWFWAAGSGLVLLTSAAWLFTRSDAGRLLVAVRENGQRCDYLGISTAKVKILLMVVAAMIAAVAGYGYAGFTDVVAPELTGFVFGTELVIWVALGGRGTLLGPVLGTIVIDVTSAYLSGSLPFVWQLFIGVAFVAVIVFLPRGLLPVAVTGWNRLRGRTGEAPRPVPALRPLAEAAAPVGSDGPALRLEGVARQYGSLRVLRDVTFTARAGELLSLIGPNGAGKTTLMRCISDGHERSGGTVAVNGHLIGRQGPERCVRYGLGRKFQTANVFDSLTVAECLRLARSRRERPSLWSRADVLHLPPAAIRVIAATGLAEHLGTAVRHLSHGLKQALELAMVLALEPDVVLLDEPTAGLTKPERQLIGSILVELTRRDGLCALLVEHDLDFVRDISSRVIVMHQGSIVLDGTVADVVGSPLVKAIYSGEDAGAEEVPA
ncbi:branched-chain amino acid ABC transporter ATP-binding protein/permease [Azospirillum sp. ST 5-10]|uniref:branched-chain amino acid ABC transporter ATP-binding protein/permease n=1 Tax=unclassified Azospirillum TaxID=2630922 RepID=UPI003F4A2732